MKKIIIENYIKELTKEQISNFSLKQGIVLNDKELNIIYNAIKKDKDIILSNRFYDYLNQYKDDLRPVVYNKILELAKKYESFIL